MGQDDKNILVELVLIPVKAVGKGLLAVVIWFIEFQHALRKG